MKSDSDAEREILEVERRLVSRVEQLGEDWAGLRRTTARRYALPLLIGTAALGAAAVGLATSRGRGKPVRGTTENTSLIAKAVALASLLGTLQRLPIGPALQWWRTRRNSADIN